MLEIYKNISKDQAAIFSLVLHSVGISHHTRKDDMGWSIFVDEFNTDRAIFNIEQYLVENKNFKKDPPPEIISSNKTFSFIWVVFILLFFYKFYSSGFVKSKNIKEFGASAFYILHGEVYRITTALFLHGDVLHLARNLAGISIFGAAVCNITGWGLGWLLILFTGVAGNYLNALLYQSGHVSIGASTAVFGALGILAVFQFWNTIRIPGKKLKVWVPLGACLPLLGFFSSGKHTDIMAHFFGLISGFFIGLVYAYFIKETKKDSIQAGCLGGALLIIFICWKKVI